MSLYESFSSVPDFRRKEGQRTPLPALLTIISLAYMCGYTSNRKIKAFAHANAGVLRELLDLKHKLPSHVTIWTCVNEVEESCMIEGFHRWINSVVPIAAGQWVSGDGKSLASTVSNMHNEKQSFTAIVSAFCQQSGLTHRLAAYRNGQQNEVHTLQELLTHFKNAGVVIALDALHCQKKQYPT